MRHYDDITRINQIAGNLPVPLSDASTWLSVFRRQLGLINEEFAEFENGLKEGHVGEIRDGIADTLVTTHGLISRLGLDSDFYTKFLTPYQVSGLTWTTSRQTAREHLDALNILAQNVETPSPATVTAMAAGLALAVMEVGHQLGFDIDADMLAVYESNLSKFDTDPETLERSQTKYRIIGVETTVSENTVDGVTYLVMLSAKDQTGTDGRQYPKGKFLKSVNFREPVFQEQQDVAVYTDDPTDQVEIDAPAEQETQTNADSAST